MNFNMPQRRTFLFANYAWNNQRNDADGAFSLPANNYDLAAEWGRAAAVPRHIASAVFNTALMRSLRLAVSTTARAGSPYTITTGRDDNGDTVFNDRPAGTRPQQRHRRGHVGRGGAPDLRVRVRRASRRPTGAPVGQMVVMRMGGGAGDLLGGLGGGGAENKRVRIELFVVGGERLQQREPDGLLGRDDVAVLRPADDGGAGAEDRPRDEGRFLATDSVF